MRWSVIPLYSCNKPHSDIYLEFVFLPEKRKQGKGYKDYTLVIVHILEIGKKTLTQVLFVSFLNFLHNTFERMF